MFLFSPFSYSTTKKVKSYIIDISQTIKSKANQVWLKTVIINTIYYSSEMTTYFAII